MTALRSPVTGAPLRHDTAHSLVDADGGRWPVVDGIPYLRTGRAALVGATLAHLDAGRPDDALVGLLADQDDWWRGPATDPDELRRLVAARDTLTLREAMALLRLGPVADYFAHRWGDPTYLAGLALLAAHWQAPRTAFELAAGIGHHLRELGRLGVAATGADVVYAKCWLARGWVAPAASYLVFDAASPWPVTDRYDLVACHDAFYFLPEQPRVAERLRAAVAPGGTLAVSHLHNAGHRGGALGPARDAVQWAEIFGDARVYDEAALRAALVERTRPTASGWVDDDAVEAWSLVEGGGPAQVVDGGIAVPPPEATLRPHPLLGTPDDPAAVAWPSPRYRDEYAHSTWLDTDGDPVRTRRLLDLPERW